MQILDFLKLLATQISHGIFGTLQKSLFQVLNDKESNHHKNHVFLDIISPEYDALTIQRSSIKSKFKTKSDPLSVQVRRGKEENKILNKKIVSCTVFLFIFEK
jgi:hypothetical protein